MAEIRIGTSGWVYPSWRTHLYQGIPVKRWLSHAAATFDTLEINGSFYTQIKPETYRRWRDQTPAGFRFALKGHRFVTHYKRLIEVGGSIERLRAQASALGDKLAVVLWQLPQAMPCDLGRLDAFLQTLSGWADVRHAFEPRHRSWFTDDVAARLAAAGVANTLSDAPDFPMWREVTTDFVYVRLHGHTRKYASSYSTGHLRRWAADARGWAAEGREVWIYFDNDAEGAAVSDALRLRRMLDIGTSTSTSPSTTTSTPRVWAR